MRAQAILRGKAIFGGFICRLFGHVNPLEEYRFPQVLITGIDCGQIAIRSWPSTAMLAPHGVRWWRCRRCGEIIDCGKVDRPVHRETALATLD